MPESIQPGEPRDVERVNATDAVHAALEPDDGDFGMAAIRLALVPSPIGGLAQELVPSPSERQHRRALEALARVIDDLSDRVDADSWRTVIGTEEFDSAFVRATEAAQRAAAEEKRRLIWFALVNGWVREKAAETRDRLLEIVDRYTLEDFKALDGLVGMAEGNADEWISVESDHHGFAMTDALKLDHGEANAYV